MRNINKINNKPKEKLNKRPKPKPLDQRIYEDNESFVKHLDKMIIPKEDLVE